jgi:1-phosphofructokinase
VIITVTLNPAVDKTTYIEGFNTGVVNRVKELRKDAGGKGINVSKVVNKLGGSTVALGFLGGTPGEFIKEELDRFDIAEDFIWLREATRTNLKIVDTTNGVETEVNELGAKVNKEQLNRLEEQILAKADSQDSVVLTGSLPPGVDDDIYAELIKKLDATDCKVFLDASGGSLRKGIASNPYLIKPNLAELEALVERKLNTIEEISQAAEKLQQQGIELVVISLGAKGSLVVSQAGNFKVTPPAVEASSTIGAGDTLVGALALQLETGKSLEEAIRYATAASANSVTKSGTQLCNKEEVEKLLDQVEVVEI